MKKHILFVCTHALSRSPTAVDLLADDPLNEAKAAGIHDDAVMPVEQQMIDWANIIFVFEDAHLALLRALFNLNGKEIYNLDIPDLYKRGDAGLIRILKEKLQIFLDLSQT